MDNPKNNSDTKKMIADFTIAANQAFQLSSGPNCYVPQSNDADPLLVKAQKDAKQTLIESIDLELQWSVLRSSLRRNPNPDSIAKLLDESFPVIDKLMEISKDIVRQLDETFDWNIQQPSQIVETYRLSVLIYESRCRILDEIDETARVGAAAITPSNADLKKLAKKYKAPQDWYNEKE